MNLPDRIFAIGGAGKAVTYELLDSNWVQEEILKPRPNPRSLTVTLVDTAEEEENRDLERIHELEAEIQETKERVREEGENDHGRPGEINIEYLPLTRNIQLHDQNDLIGKATVPRITSGKGMDEDNWWLKPKYINENLDFATGVVRKRGLGKGLYYKAYAEDDDVRTSIDLPSKGKVAVIAGLGGGTGSGIFIDLVRDLKQTNRTAEITLFGVLPNDEEGDAECANAHAALSELEYLRLKEEDIFKDRVLIPIDPTGFGGKKSNILESSDELVEFDQAVSYLIISYYNMMDMEDPFANHPSHAPFIMGIPQIARYNVDEIQDAKVFINDILSAKENAVDAQADIYSGIERFFSKEWDIDEPEGELHDADVSDLETRLEDIKSLLEFDLFEELNYESVSIYRDIISQAESESDDIVEKVGVIGGSIRAGTTQLRGESDQFVDSTDKLLADVVQEALLRLIKRKDLLRQLRGVEDSQIQSTISYLIGLETDNVNPGVRLNQLEKKLEEAKDRKERLESDLEETKQEIEKQQQERQEEINQQLESWERTGGSLFDEYVEARSIDISAITDDLEIALDNFAREIVDADTIELVESIDDAEVRTAVNDIEGEVEKVGININQSKQSINSSLRDLKSAKKSFIKMNQESGSLESVIPWETSAEEERKEAQRNYKMKRADVDDKDVFVISRTGDSLSVESKFNTQHIVTQINEEINTKKQAVVNEINSVLEENHPAIMDDIRATLGKNTNFASLTELVRDAIEKEVIEEDDLEERLEDLENDLAATENDVSRYGGTASLFEEINKIREKLQGAKDRYRDNKTEFKESRKTDVSTEEDSYGYIKTMQPDNILQIREDSDIRKSKLLDNGSEQQRLRSTLEELAQNAHKPQYTGIKKRRISNGRARYNEMNAVVGVMSRAMGKIGDIADLENQFTEAYNLGPGGKNYASFPVEAGGNWDVALSMFIGGIFMDNLRAEVAADGYLSGYESRQRSDDTDIIVHHSHKLDDGWYVQRDKLLNLENENDTGFFLRDEGEINEELLNDYIEKYYLNQQDQKSPDSGGK